MDDQQDLQRQLASEFSKRVEQAEKGVAKPAVDVGEVMADIWMPWRLQKALYWEHVRRHPEKFPNVNDEDGWRFALIYDDAGDTLAEILESHFAEHPEQGQPFTRP